MIFQLKKITPKELAEHNKEADVWLAIRGKVFNVTRYLPFHPGGPQELMKGAGRDATELFEQVSPPYKLHVFFLPFDWLIKADPSEHTRFAFFPSNQIYPTHAVI